MNHLEFIKMEAIGNHFVLLNGFDLPEMNWSLLAENMCLHHFGVGSDGLLVVLPSGKADFRMRMYNPDGSEDSCGNGLRSAAMYWYKNISNRQDNMSIEARDGIKYVNMINSARYGVIPRVNMGEPSLDVSDIPAIVDTDRMIDYPLDINGITYLVTCVDMGTPHAFIRASLDDFWDDIPAVSADIETHPVFPEKINVDWIAPGNPGEVKIRTWERSIGPTMGCGTGACSAIVAANIYGMANEEIDVTSQGGTLHIEWPEKRDIYMSGPADMVFWGKWALAINEEELFVCS